MLVRTAIVVSVFFLFPCISQSTVVDSPQLVARLVVGDTLDSFGRFIAPAGDLNNDGFDDVWIGRTFDNVFTEYLLYFGGQPFDTIPDYRSRLAAKGICNVGDFNSDGLDDFIIVHNDSVSPQATFFGLHFGGQGLSSGPALRFPVHETASDFGYYEHVIGGDLNDDGAPDLLLGEPGSYSLGGAYFYSGRPLDTIVDLVFRWGEYPKQFQCGITSTFVSNFDGND